MIKSLWMKSLVSNVLALKSEAMHETPFDHSEPIRRIYIYFEYFLNSRQKRPRSQLLNIPDATGPSLFIGHHCNNIANLIFLVHSLLFRSHPSVCTCCDWIGNKTAIASSVNCQIVCSSKDNTDHYLCITISVFIIIIIIPVFCLLLMVAACEKSFPSFRTIKVFLFHIVIRGAWPIHERLECVHACMRR